jgi:hypothetical protein
VVPMDVAELAVLALSATLATQQVIPACFHACLTVPVVHAEATDAAARYEPRKIYRD